MDIAEKLELYSEPSPTGCRLWTRGLNSYGYGAVWYDGKARGAHRLAYALAIGRQPAEGMGVLHRCDTPRCINPEHLYEGDQAENLRGGVGRDRSIGAPLKTHCKHGHPFEGDNLYVAPGGTRHCRSCRAATAKAAHHRRKE